MDDAQPGGVEQLRQGRAQSVGPGQRLLDAHRLTDMGQETPDRVEPRGRPAVPVDRVVDDPDDARAIGPVQAHIDAVPGVGAGQQLVVCRGGLQLPLGVEAGNVVQPAVGGMPQAEDAFVHGVVDLVVLALQFPVPVPTKEVPRQVDADVLFGVPVADHHAAAVREKGLVDKRRSGRPVVMVERHLVQRSQNAVERLPFAHDCAFACGRSAGLILIRLGGKYSPFFRIISATTSRTIVVGAHSPRR